MKSVVFSHQENTISCTKAFLKKASMIGTSEYQLLMKYKAMAPSYSISVRQPKANPSKKTYSKLTFSRMREYIKIQYSSDEEANEALKRFDAAVAVAKSKGAMYPLTKKWFFEHYPNYKDRLTDEEVNNAARIGQSPSAEGPIFAQVVHSAQSNPPLSNKSENSSRPAA